MTVLALAVMMTGTASSPAGARARRHGVVELAPALLLAGLGGGAVVSPNMTLTLAEVPPRMGGAAGGALQTGQRIGSAIGAALLMTVYQAFAVLHLGRGRRPLGALSRRWPCSSVALAAAVRSWRLGD